MKTWMMLICGAVVVAACGQKGPLYLPDKNASVVTRPGASTSQSVPQTPQGSAPETAPLPTTAPEKDQDSDGSQSSGATPPKP